MIEISEHPIITILKKAMQCNMKGEFVNIRLMAPSNSAKTTIVNAFEGNYGIDITTTYSTPSFIRDDKAKYIRGHQIHTEIFEDVSWLKGAKNPAMVCDSWKQIIDGKAGANQYDSDNPSSVSCGLIITGTDDLFRRKNIKTAYESANLDTRLVDVMFQINPASCGYIMNDMMKRKQQGLSKFSYPHVDLFKVPYTPVDLTDEHAMAVRYITTVPRIADQLFTLLKAGVPLEYLKYFQKPMKEINICICDGQV